MTEGCEEVTNVSAVSESVSSMCESNLDGALKADVLYFQGKAERESLVVAQPGQAFNSNVNDVTPHGICTPDTTFACRLHEGLEGRRLDRHARMDMVVRSHADRIWATPTQSTGFLLPRSLRARASAQPTDNI